MWTFQCLRMTCRQYRPQRSTRCGRCWTRCEVNLLSIPELHLMGNIRRLGMIAVSLAAAGCAGATAGTGSSSTPAVEPPLPSHGPTYPTGNDPRNGLKYGKLDAGEALSGMRLVSFTPKPAVFDTTAGLSFINSDIAFKDHYVYQGNFAGFMIWDVANPSHPVSVAVVPCITSQGDPSVYGNLLFISAEGGGNRNDCAKGGVKNPSEHMAGVRIYDISNPATPRLIKNVQTCKGSHTHTIIPDPKDKGVIYIYVSGSQDARPATELAGCNNGTAPNDPNHSLFRLDVIKVPLAHPAQAAVVTGARIFTDMIPAPRRTPSAGPGGGGAGGRGGRGGRG